MLLMDPNVSMQDNIKTTKQFAKENQQNIMCYGFVTINSSFFDIEAVSGLYDAH